MTTDFQNKILDWLTKYKHADSIGGIAHMIKSNRLAVYSACKSLEKKGLVVVWRHNSGQTYGNSLMVSKTG
jgi:phage gp46-like protein